MSEQGARPSITPDMVERFAAYYAHHLTWGSLHIVLDDGNYSNASVDWCIAWAADHGDSEGHALALILRSLTRSQRGRIDRKARQAHAHPSRR